MPSKRLAILFTALGILLVWIAFSAAPWGIMLAWLGLDFLILGYAYLRYVPEIFGKRANGTLPMGLQALFLPYQLYALAIWHVSRLVSSEDRVNRVTSDIYVGRRLLHGELPEGIEVIVDLTSEFHEPRSIRNRPGYMTFPILDGSAPAPEALMQYIGQIPEGKVVFIHCAQGHGRTGLVALALLLDRGYANSVDKGFAMLKAIRPGIGLSKGQWACLRNIP